MNDNCIKIYSSSIDTSSENSFSNNSSDEKISSDDKILKVDLKNTNIDNKKKSSNIFIENNNVYNNSNKLDSITLDSEDINFRDTEFYDYNTLKDLSKDSFSNIYNILIKTTLIIFIDNFKIVASNKCYHLSKNCFVQKKITDEKFPGCVFLSFEYKKVLLQYLTKLNKNVLKSELGNKEFIDSDKENYYCICFDEGEIYKNCIYKKLEIKNKLLFIPINTYKLKITEYKIRGFCQIMEELGAKEINITFSNISNKKTNKNGKINANIGALAGNLGFSAHNNNDNSNNENRKYKLTYSNSHIITLNENSIRNKIKNKKFIISENNYNSNLELQYVISSRCRYFITKYSTAFTLDTSLSIDKNLSSKFKKYNIGIESNINYKTLNNNHISIITEVNFIEDNQLKDNLFGSCVSLDYIGFNYLIKSLSKENLKNKGIFKIMEFIEFYCNKKIKISNKKKYETIIRILNKIKKTITIKEYALLLENYFNTDSEWIHFKNFINLLALNNTSYDQLGYLIIVENKNLTKKEKVNKLINFLHHNCVENISTDPLNEKKFWRMLRPLNKKLEYFLIHKIDYQYNFIDTYNWHSINKILDDISDYSIINIDDNKNTIFNKLYKNLSLGYTYLEFYEKMIPFIENISNNLNFENCNNQNNSLEKIIDSKTNEEYLKNTLINIIHYESFMKHRVNTYDKLIIFIKQKMEKVNLGNRLINELTNEYDNENDKNKEEGKNIETLKKILFQKIYSNDFIKKYKYFDKKIRLIFESNLDNEIIKEKIINFYFSNKKIITSVNARNKYFINRILTYNEKLNMKNLPANYFGYYLMNNRFCNGSSEIEIKLCVIPFIKKIIERFANEQYKSDSIYYNKIIKLRDTFLINTKENLEELKYLSTYSKLVNYIIKILNNNLKNKINYNIIKNIIES